jgi:site-specific recombinase XerD
MGEYTAIVKQDGDWWIGWIEEVPGVNCQERSREALLETLRISLHEALEANRADGTFESALVGGRHARARTSSRQHWRAVQTASTSRQALAGITRRFRFHDQRHAFASTLASKGINSFTLRDLLGHTAPARRYATRGQAPKHSTL